jgi:dipeptidyl aminopeptidase/acylaminoacyl peptidase
MKSLAELKEVAWIADEFVQQPIRGIIFRFHGLGCPELREKPDEEELEWAKKGFLVVFPYYGPWSWMNRQARKFVDDLAASIYAVYSLSADIPLLVAGGSMGGYSALLYARYAKQKLSGCVAVCPVCDLKYHFTERRGLPRTIRDAFRGYEQDLESLFMEHSPVCQVDAMPPIPYLIIHTTGDAAVSKEHHSDKLAAKMKERGLDVTYIEVPGSGHCGPLPQEVEDAKLKFVLRCAGV